MTKKEQRERQAQNEILNEIRRRNTCEFFTRFTVFFRPWLHELTRRYKERGQFPLMSCWLLPSYYQRKEDIEVAAILAMILKDDEELLLERVTACRQMLGESPYEWFRNREFIPLGFGAVRDKCPLGVTNGRIAAYMGSVYDNWDNREALMSIIMVQHFGQKHYWNRLQLLRLVLGTPDGIGLGVWAITPPDPKSPLTANEKALLSNFFPDYYRCSSPEEAIGLFQFERDSDFFYAALAYKEFAEKKPKESEHFVSLYQRRYKQGMLLEQRYWTGSRSILPEIEDFNDKD